MSYSFLLHAGEHRLLICMSAGYRQYREQHCLCQQRCYLCGRRAENGSRLSAKSRAEDAVPDAHPRLCGCYRSSGRKYRWLSRSMFCIRCLTGLFSRSFLDQFSILCQSIPVSISTLYASLNLLVYLTPGKHPHPP